MKKVIVVYYEEDPEAIAKCKMDCRYVWEEHVNLISRAITSVMAELKDISAIQDQLTINCKNIGNLLMPFYSMADASKLANLILEHANLGAKVILAVKNGKDTSDLQAASLTNGKAIATFLSTLDPDNWPYDTLLDAWKSHLDCTEAQANARYVEDWTADLIAYEGCRSGIITIADCMADGITNKFPDKFVKYH